MGLAPTNKINFGEEDMLRSQISQRFHRLGNYLMLALAVSTPAIVVVELVRAAFI